MSFTNRKPIQTGDGSFSLELGDGSETYHSRHGALSESRYVFIQKGLEPRASAESLSVLEVGFGTGLNALLAWEWAEQNACQVHYVSLETYPLSEAEWSSLTFEVPIPSTPAAFQALHEAAWNTPVQLAPNFTLEKRQLSWLEHPTAAEADVLFYDAFGPPTQPEMWTAHALFRAAQVLRPHGTFVTYCAKGVVRRRLEAAGLRVERLPGPPGKREMLRAEQPEVLPPDLARFNVRAYLILCNAANDAVLVAEEKIAGQRMTKFPGGGVEFGEGPEDAVLREALEELERPVRIEEHVYTTGTFQRSAFRGEDQLLSIYYRVSLEDSTPFEVLEPDEALNEEKALQFRWVPLTRLADWPFTFPIDLRVAGMLGR